MEIGKIVEVGIKCLDAGDLEWFIEKLLNNSYGKVIGDAYLELFLMEVVTDSFGNSFFFIIFFNNTII